MTENFQFTPPKPRIGFNPQPFRIPHFEIRNPKFPNPSSFA
jgi:hypothetical protein